jgi:tetratricopeptide (TPR) repeat protein
MSALPADHTDRLFLSEALPLMRADGHDAALLLGHWPPGRLARLLGSEVVEVVQTAAACLARFGTPAQCRSLAGLLHHPDRSVASLAERALWEIWFRGSSPETSAQLASAVGMMDENDEGAIEMLEELTADEPRFVEAHHQLGIALLMRERAARAIAALGRAVELCPVHFSAWLNLGHAHAFRADAARALAAWRAARRIHPRLEGVAELIVRVEASPAYRPPAH